MKIASLLAVSCALFAGCMERLPEDSPILSGKIVNSSSSSEEGTLLLQFSGDAPETIPVLSGDSLCRVHLEPLFRGSSDTDLGSWYIAAFSPAAPSEEIAVALSERSDIIKIQYNKIISQGPEERVQIADGGLQTKSTAATSVFNDPYLSDQWHLINTGSTSFCKTAVEGADVSVKDAWRLTAGDPSVIVAVLDGGVMYNHPDLAANMWTNDAELRGEKGKDDDGNGYVDDVYGYNFVSGNPEITWNQKIDSGHATHVAGTVAAVNDNGVGVCGVAGGSGNGDGVRIMSCQIFENKNSTSAAVARAFMYAADNGASVAQCSFGYDPGSFATEEDFMKTCSAEYAGIQYFLDKKNCRSDVVDGNIIVFSAGNEGLAKADYPGALRDVIAVTSFGPGFQPAGYTNYGVGCNIAAPGGDYYVGRAGYNKKCQILSTIPGEDSSGEYGWMEGTSMATPHVSGVVALGLSYAKKLGLRFSREDFISMLLTSVNGIDGYFTGTKPKNGVDNMDLSGYVGKMGTGAVDTWRFLMNIEGTPSVQVGVGRSSIDLGGVLGATSASIKNLSVKMDQESMRSLGISEEPHVNGNILTLKCSKSGSGYMTVRADSEGIAIERKISLISRPAVSGNGGWL